jgi:hypothetical protein
MTRVPPTTDHPSTPVTTFNRTFVPSLVTSNLTVSVTPFMSGVELSVNVAVVEFQTTITVPALESSESL